MQVIQDAVISMQVIQDAVLSKKFWQTREEAALKLVPHNRANVSLKTTTIIIKYHFFNTRFIVSIYSYNFSFIQHLIAFCGKKTCAGSVTIIMKKAHEESTVCFD